jgi:hypothetical protein
MSSTQIFLNNWQITVCFATGKRYLCRASLGDTIV